MSTTTPSSSTVTTNTTLTGPPPSSPTSISTSSSLPTNTSPGSSTAPPTGNTTTLSPSTTNSGVTGHTNLTHSTEPTSGNTTASSTTTPTSTTTISTGTTITGTTQRPTDVTTNNSTTTPTSTTTISTGTTITGTTQRPTDVTTNNSTTTPTSTTTISTGSTITGTTQPPTDVTTNNSTTAPTSTTTISAGTTITGTTQRPTDVTTNNSTTTPTSTTTISAGTTITGTTQRPTDVTTNNSTTTPTSTTTISTGTTITGTTQRPTDVTTNNSTNAPTSTTTISTGTTITGTTQRPTDVTTNNSTTTPTSTTTISAGTTITSATQRPTDTTTAPPIPPVCPTVPCPPESECLNGTCQCLSGSFLVDGRCAPVQMFSGQLHLMSLPFENEMSNRSSKIFQETAAQISEVLRDALKNQPGYKQSDVVQLKPGSVLATVNNIFDKTTATQMSVDQAIIEAIANPANALLANATFTGTNLCDQDPLPCDVLTTMCTNSNGRAVCSCKAGYISILYSNTSCRACPSGQRAVGNVCQLCAFGYAGFNCNDSSLLAMVVISCVLGAVLLIIVLALLTYYCWRGCTKSKSDYSSSPYSSGDLNQPWPTGITPIPRATTNWDATPPIEMSEGGSTRVLVDKKPRTNGLEFQPKHTGWKKSGTYDLNPEGMNTFKGKTPSRYSYLVQGHENPYFLPGDGKKD
ncbi:hypothetical protein VZT92_007692 [Zoarces viviparus]|uniref:SEA domain-containing protein n=1 Tax=Zoarces viviparus TaxID=48416 RepID=A0AAW1FL48_ZOAVI